MSKRTTTGPTVEDLETTYLHEGDGEGPSKRIRALVRKLHDAMAELEAERVARASDADGHTAALEAARIAADKAAREALGSEHAAALAQRDEDLGLSRLGISDDDAIHLLRRDHARLPAEGRPAIVDYARKLQTDEGSRAGKSAALLAGLGIGAKPANGDAGPARQQPARAASGAGAGKPDELSEESIRQAFAQAATNPGALRELISRMG